MWSDSPIQSAMLTETTWVGILKYFLSYKKENIEIFSCRSLLHGPAVQGPARRGQGRLRQWVRDLLCLPLQRGREEQGGGPGEQDQLH